MGGFALQLSGKEAIKKLPSKVYSSADRISKELMSTSILRKQDLRYER
jgi:hypothetical protein